MYKVFSSFAVGFLPQQDIMYQVFSSFDVGFFPSTRHYVLGFLLFLPQVFSFNKSNAEGENLTSLSFASLESIPAEKLPLRHDSLPSINHLRQPRFVIFCNNRDHGQKETGGLCSLVHKREEGKEPLSSLISFIQKRTLIKCINQKH